MKLKVNESMILVGTPEEMAEFLRQVDEPVKHAEPKAEPKAEKPSHGRGKIDWPKAEALRAAGWSQRKIADELGIHETTVSNHFRKAKGAEHEGTDEPV